MNKDQLLHLHGLLGEVRKEVDERDNLSTPEYDKIETGPMSLHKSKNDHKTAVFTLASDLAEQTQEVTEQTQEETIEV